MSLTTAAPAEPWDDPRLLDLIRAALQEDIGAGDVTTEAVIPADHLARARLVARRPTVVCGLPLLGRVFALQDSRVQVEATVAEGTWVPADTTLARISGPARALLVAERTALNFLARLCGIATLTRQFVEALAGSGVELRDTRKTTPLWRVLEKYAVRTGGGHNHRFGLFDGILIKENHLSAVGSIAEAVRRAQPVARQRGLAVEVEVRNETEARQALQAGADELLLDNLSPEEASRLIALVRRLQPGCRIELSGGVNLANVRRYAAAGPDAISVGALTHSAPAADLSLLFES